MNPTERTLLTWLHVSDVHLGHGTAANRWDQQLVLDTLRADLAHLARDGFPAPDVILATGDIASSGRVDEYVAAASWIDAVATLLAVPSSMVFLVPGNHDVQRDVDAGNRGVKRLQ